MSQIKLKNITQENWTKVLNLFDDLEKLNPIQQQKSLKDINLDDDAKNLLHQMLNTQDTSDWLEKPIDELANALMENVLDPTMQNPDEMKGRQFGAWKVIAELAQGGMGQVFVAERADGQFAKEVALKTIKSGAFSNATKEKFMAEMQTLAQLEHPNIARLIDGGVSQDGILFFVMELVNGVPIIEYAKTNQLTLNQRLDLVIQLCQAVAYAHQNLIIHGDLKPDNVLVNHEGQIKLLDFGVAASSQPWIGEQKLALPQFTYAYASPEQLVGKKLTTATDVYGLAAILYQLCIGHPPRDASQQINDKSLNHVIIPISQRMAEWQLHKNQFKQQLPGLKHSEMSKQLATELGALIAKGLAEDVQNRYKTAVELETDLKAVKNHEAIFAFSTTKSYLLKKRLAKFKLPIIVGLIGFIGITTFALMSLFQYRLTKIEAQKANWNNAFLMGLFDAADPIKNQLKPITVNDLAQQAADELLNKKTYVPTTQLSALNLLAEIQSKLGSLNSAAQLRELQIQILTDGKASNHALAEAYLELGLVNEQQDKLAQALNHFSQANLLMPLRKGINPLSVNAAQSLANTQLRLSQNDVAKTLVEELLASESSIRKLDNQNDLLAAIYGVKAKLNRANNDFIQALSAIEIAKRYAKKSQQTNPFLYTQILSIESETYYQKGDTVKSAQVDQLIVNLLLLIYGPNHPKTLSNQTNLAISLSNNGEMGKALQIYQEVLDSYLRLNIKGQKLPAVLLSMGTTYKILGQFDLALEKYQQAALLWPQLSPRMPIYEVSNQIGMAQTLARLGRYNESERNFLAALAITKETFGKNHHLMARFEIYYANLLLIMNRTEQAASIIPHAHEIISNYYGEKSKHKATSALITAKLRYKQGFKNEAKIYAQQAIDVFNLEKNRLRYFKQLNDAREILKNSSE